MVMMMALTLGFTVIWPGVLLMACQNMHGYPGRSHKNFCCVKNFFPCWSGCRIIILHISGLRHSWVVGDHGVPHECWSCSTNVIRWIVEDHVVSNHWSFVVVHWRRIIMAFSNNCYIFLNKLCDHIQQLKQHFSTSSVITSSS